MLVRCWSGWGIDPLPPIRATIHSVPKDTRCASLLLPALLTARPSGFPTVTTAAPGMSALRWSTPRASLPPYGQHSSLRHTLPTIAAPSAGGAVSRGDAPPPIRGFVQMQYPPPLRGSGATRNGGGCFKTQWIPKATKCYGSTINYKGISNS